MSPKDSAESVVVWDPERAAGSWSRMLGLAMRRYLLLWHNPDWDIRCVRQSFTLLDEADPAGRFRLAGGLCGAGDNRTAIPISEPGGRDRRSLRIRSADRAGRGADA